MTSPIRTLFADHARLPEGWKRNVLLEWDDDGALVSVAADSAMPARTPRAAGPVIAGMPNVHSHAFQRAMAGLTEYRASATDTFWSWRDLMYRFAARIGPESLAAVARWVYIEMLKAGYTSVCEFHYVHHSSDGTPYANRAEMAQQVVDAAGQAGIGITMLPVLYQYNGFNRSAPREDQRRFLNTPEALLELLDTLCRARPENGARRYGVAPHSLRAVSGESLSALLEGLDARFDRAPVHIHVAEQIAEVEACLAATRQRPVEWLLERFAVDDRWCLVHATHVDANECTRLAGSGAVAGLCLTTEANLGDGVFPTRDYLDAGGASASVRTATSPSTGARSCACSNTASACAVASATCSHRRRRAARPSACSTPRSKAARARAAARSARSRRDTARTGSCSTRIIRASRGRIATRGFQRRVLRAWRHADPRRLRRRAPGGRGAPSRGRRGSVRAVPHCARRPVALG